MNRMSMIVSFGWLLVAGTLTLQAAPAPPLTSVQITAVRSAMSLGWENVSQYQSMTTNNHGGTWIQATTVEYGYASPTVCKLGGVYAKQISVQAIVSNGVMIGRKRVWEVRSTNSVLLSSGTFFCEAMSTVFPYSKRSDSIFIR